VEPTEEPLAGGNVAEVVVRVGDTVRKPASAATPAVDALLTHLQQAGFPASPRAFGVDEHDRHVLEYVPGVPADKAQPLTEDELHRLGALVRELHDMTAHFVPPPGAGWQVIIPPDREDLVVHHDLAPWNLIRDGDRWVFIDWDGAGPGSRLWDLAYCAQTFAGLWEGQDPDTGAVRLRAIANGYRLGAEQRLVLPGILRARTRSMYDLLDRGHRCGRQPWARLHAEGHWRPWLHASEFIERHQRLWMQSLADGP
jgi:Ser/Thr protein kinase RdoA (MazF antagonist)